jgi:hypothetical protein
MTSQGSASGRLAGVTVEGSSLNSERTNAVVIVLDDDLIDEAGDRLPDTRRSPSTGRLAHVEFVDELGELSAHAEAQHKAQLMPVHVDLL